MHMHKSRSGAGADDAGFSLIEAVVALAIATAVFTALAFALIGGTKSALLSQQNQQAGDVLNRAVEEARALTYSQLTLRTSDLNVGEAARTPTLAGCLCYNPTNDSTSGPGVEPLASPGATGGLNPHQSAVMQNGGTFTVRRYVTAPADASGATYKRLTVVVSWNGLGKARTRTYSTLVADTKRGLPLPDFKFTNAATPTQCRNPGSEVVYAFNLKNNGARDAWRLTATSVTPAWTFYADEDDDAAFVAGEDQPLPVVGGAASTGLIEPTSALRFLAVRTLPATPAPYTVTSTFRATSAAQPSYFQELTVTTTVVATPCGGTATPSPSPGASTAPSPSASPTPSAPTQPPASCATLTGAATTSAPGGTLVRYLLQNYLQPGDTVAGINQPVARDSGAALMAGSLYNYSTDLHSAAGRYLQFGTGPGANQLLSWTYVMPATSVLKGQGAVTLWARPASGLTTDKPSVRVVIERLNSAGAAQQTLGTLDYTASAGWGCTGMRPFSLSLPTIGGNGQKVLANEQIRVSVRLLNAVPMVFGYGTSAYASELNLPYKSGLG